MLRVKTLDAESLERMFTQRLFVSAILSGLASAAKDKNLVYEFDGVWKLTHKG